MRSNTRSNDRDDALFPEDAPRHSAGRVRKGLDADVRAAAEVQAQLPSAGVAALRSLADQIDQLERQLRSPYAKPYDRLPLAGLVREFRETYEQTFAALQRAEDPLTRAFADLLAAEQSGVPAPSDTAGPVPAD